MISLRGLLVVALCCCSLAREDSITGSLTSCKNEGQVVNVESISNLKCFTCVCKNGYVQCSRNKCLEVDGCYAVLPKETGECCEKCKGCIQDGTFHESGTSWSGKDPCQVFYCKAGVITETKILCTEQCENAVAVKGQCCPSCSSCQISVISVADDPCVSCTCVSGRLICQRVACPVLHCPASKISLAEGKCCLTCTGHGTFLSPPKGGCLLGNKLYKSGEDFQIDECTKCNCNEALVTCQRETCPKVNCPEEQQFKVQGSCCTRCKKSPEKSEAPCTKPVIQIVSSGNCYYHRKSYTNGEYWRSGCKLCRCTSGRVKCDRSECRPQSRPTLPQLEHLKVNF